MNEEYFDDLADEEESECRRARHLVTEEWIQTQEGEMLEIENREAFDYQALSLVNTLMALQETQIPEEMKSILALVLAIAEIKDAGKKIVIADPLEVLARMEALPVEGGQARLLAIRDVVWAIAS